MVPGDSIKAKVTILVQRPWIRAAAMAAATPEAVIRVVVIRGVAVTRVAVIQGEAATRVAVTQGEAVTRVAVTQGEAVTREAATQTGEGPMMEGGTQPTMKGFRS
jgi:hypothetical protein